MDKIYTITVLTCLEEDEIHWPYFGDTRTIGWVPTEDDARTCVENNYADMYEMCYHYAVVEEVEMGLYPCCWNRWFYEYDEEMDGYREIPEPKWMSGFVNLGIG